MFVLEDEAHAESLGQFESMPAAVARLEVLAATPWDAPPNVAPCRNWRACGRRYEIVEYETSRTPWTLLSSTRALDVSARGVEWFPDRR